jgi:thiosulfate dehydrogenase (quinone) large subunit
MTKYQKISLFLLRISVGWMMFYAGITKVINPSWSAEGYLKGAKTFPGLFQWFLQPNILPLINFVNEWGLTLLGVALILGVFVRISSILGAVLMLLYYLPILDFPYPNLHSYIVDEHIIYAFVLLLFASLRAGRVWGLENWCSNLPICSKYPKLRNWLG